MRAYAAVSGSVFGLLAVLQIVHGVRDPEHLGEPAFLFHVAGALALALWALRILVTKPPRPEPG